MPKGWKPSFFFAKNQPKWLMETFWLVFTRKRVFPAKLPKGPKGSKGCL